MPRGACSTFLTVAGPGVSLARASWSSRAHLMSRPSWSTVIPFASLVHGAQMWPDELTNDD
jgi:hypothetical protein